MKFPTILSISAAAAVACIASAPVLADEAAAGSAWRQVAYNCESGQPLNVAFRESGRTVQVSLPDKPAVTLMGRPAKSGFRYSDSRYELRGEGDAVTLKIGSKTAVKCTSDDPAAPQLAAAVTR